MKSKKWCVVHWLSGEVKMFGSEKECQSWAKKNSFNPKAPIYYAFPVAGLIVHSHIHEHTHKELKEKVGRLKANKLSRTYKINCKKYE